MEIILKKNKVFCGLLLFLFLVSCNSKTIFSEFKTMPGTSWKANDKVSFEFEVQDTISPKNLFINIRNNNNYPYSNLYLITELNFANGTKVIDTLQYEMTDNLGNFLGSGFAEIKENKLFYKENKIFSVPGKHVFSVRQAMRKNGEIHPIEFLEGIQDVGFSIEKTK
ncbi:gliding motility lipoprotein GldH [uncultured Polaribacter sp.]|uniref:gliding motility lipoprotein GldH n=1 Tax=uncultured Polaribacter sp. TaxID=174711 RepID=UPI00262E0FED|nr:gliding motility lipoprotein GldH [uncultured Polaribacter sp.]